MTKRFWNVERLDLLIKLSKEGIPVNHIALWVGTTTNSVIGMRGRLRNRGILPPLPVKQKKHASCGRVR